MPHPLPRKLDFICTLVEPPNTRAWYGASISGLLALAVFIGADFASGSIWAVGAFKIAAAVFAIMAVLFYSSASNSFDSRAKVQVEVGLDGLRLPLQNIPFRNLKELRVESSVAGSAAGYSTLELILNDGETLRLNMLDAERVAYSIRERHALYKRLTAPRPRARPDGYRGVRVEEEAESIEEGLRQEGWAEDNLEAVLARALVIPQAER